jgi:hypothetical protein
MQRLSPDAVKRLAKYWYRAEVMRDVVHAMREDLTKMPKSEWWYF